jgi:hypothetical protein
MLVPTRALNGFNDDSYLGHTKATSNLGLIDQKFPTDKGGKSVATLTSWQRFEAYVESLNKKNEQYTYKVLFMGRHGQGFHNAAESYFGTPAWNVRCVFHLVNLMQESDNPSATTPSSKATPPSPGPTRTSPLTA